VCACTKGEEALELFKKGGVDLVLTDLVMPGFDGSRLIQEIKAISPETPAILLSGKIRIYDRDTQADVFLPKGMYAPAELLERIRLLLIRKRGPKRPQNRQPATTISVA
jgi:DNA-binding response OmpR family regulator